MAQCPADQNLRWAPTAHKTKVQPLTLGRQRWPAIVLLRSFLFVPVFPCPLCGSCVSWADLELTPHPTGSGDGVHREHLLPQWGQQGAPSHSLMSRA